MTLIKGIASIGAAMLIGLSALSARAGYIVDLRQQGSDVVASASGAIDLTGLRLFNTTCCESPALNATSAVIITGRRLSEIDGYTGLVSGPMDFGNGSNVASSGSGDLVALLAHGDILEVPTGYVSDSPLSSTATWDSQTFMSLGATPGTYKWTWGTGANQNFTLVIGAVVPEPSTWAMMLLGFAGLGFMGHQSAGRRRTVINA
jgi:PEP-CTERM motif